RAMRSRSPGARCAQHLWRRVLLATLLSAAGLSQGQEPDTRQPPDAAPGPVTAEPGTSATEGPDTTAADEGAPTSPFEYEASEQISEDLSVSFPVDI
ncbi:MAG TPA: hypothetical protein VIC02_04020, partial [Kineobactrum sp.]